MTLMNTIRNLIQKLSGADSSLTEKDQGPDLFEYARLKIEEEKSEDLQELKEEEERKRRNLILILLILLLFLPIAFLGGYILADTSTSCEIERHAIIHTLDGKKEKTLIQKLSDLTIITNPETDNNTEKRFDLASISRIDFLDEPIENDTEEDENIRELTADEKKFLGRYVANISGHKATMYVYATKKGYIGISLKFHTWGRGVSEYMRQVRVNGDTISFRRSCKGVECARIGSPSPIRQFYEGTISDDLIKIEGRYEGGQNASRWSAIRNR